MEQSGLGRFGAVLCLTLLGCGEGPTGPDSERALADAAVDRFVAANPTGWITSGRAEVAPSRPAWTRSCSDPQSNGTVSLRVRTDNGDLELSFACPVSAQSTPEQLEYQLVGVVPWNLANEIRAPNWQFQAWLPLSTVRTGIAFHRNADGRLAVHISSFMNGIEGMSQRPACGAADFATLADAGCALRRAHRIPMEIHFTMPADLSALR